MAAPEGQVDGRTARWQGHRERRRAEFVDAAVRVIEREGPGTSVDRISAELGVGRQALYRQFEDRADLDRAIADRAADLLAEELVPRLAPSGDVERVITGALRAYLDFVQSHLHLYLFVRAHDSGTVSRIKDTVAVRVAALARDLLVAAASAPVDAADTLATAVIGLTDAVISRWLDEPGLLDRDEVVRRLLVMVRGAGEALLAAPSAAPA